MSEMLPIWTVYDHPKDFPNRFVARLWIGERATGNVIVEQNLNVLRDRLEGMGLVKLMRQPSDDPVILETWL
jgi:hypothetical protein